MSSGKHTRGRPIDIALAVVDEDYYAQIRRQLRSTPAALRAFQLAVDAAWCRQQAHSA